jgi:hypothetical protein
MGTRRGAVPRCQKLFEYLHLLKLTLRSVECSESTRKGDISWSDCPSSSAVRKKIILVSMLLVLPTLSAAFLLAPHPHTYRGGAQAFAVRSVGITACAAEEAKGGEVQAKGGEIVPFTPAQVEEVGNLVEDDEWLGLATELMIVMRCAVRESVKKNVREFTGSDEYAVGDLSKEADARVKAKVAELRGKEEYEVRPSLNLTAFELRSQCAS